jgi:hypothetical protein
MLARVPQRPNRIRRQVAASKALVAPVGGWDASNALASMPADRAVELKNWFPTPTSVEVRKGHRWHAWDFGSNVKQVATPASDIDTSGDEVTLSSHGFSDGDVVKCYATTTVPGGLSATDSYYIVASSSTTFQLSQTSGGSAVDITSTGSGDVYFYKLDNPAVETLAIWQGPASSKMFGATDDAIWDVTASQAATLSYATSVSEGRWQWCMHSAGGTAYLYMVNGTDAPIHYNGSTWAAPSISGITASDAISVCSHKRRLWFALKDTLKGAYLDTEAISGAAATFDFGPYFSRGGSLLAIATWTRDGGAGADDLFVAITSRGQVAIYQGTDPAFVNTWSLVGVFDIPTPIGRRCVSRFGADLLVLTLEGVFPLSQLLAVDQSQSRRVAISENIANAFAEAAIDYKDNHGWEIVTYPKGTRLLVNIPTSEGSTAKQYGMNTLTGAWFEQDGHDAITWAVYNDTIYFAGGSADVYRADIGRADVDVPIVAVGQTSYSAYGNANLKRFSMIRPLVSALGSNRPSIGISVDFVETQNLSALGVSSGTSTGTLWDAATWDSSTWSSEDQTITDWATVTALGTWGSVKFTATTGVDSGGSGWSLSTWGESLWGSQGQLNDPMKVNGFIVVHEGGALL